MKKLLLCIVFAGSNAMFAQTERGKVFFSGGAGMQFSSSQYTENSSKYSMTTISTVPTFGVFVANNFAVGLDGYFATTSLKYEGSGGKYTYATVSLMPSLFYYFPLDGNLKPYLQAGAGYGSRMMDSDLNGGLSYKFGTGISYFISKNVAFNLGFSYSKLSLKLKEDSAYKSTEGNFSSNIGISVFF